jgi:pyruvate,orthophosphate dikinase
MVDQLLRDQFDPAALAKAALIAKGLNASPGAAVGKAVFEADRAAALAAGFERYFVKPVDTGELAAMLDDIGRRRGEGQAG